MIRSKVTIMATSSQSTASESSFSDEVTKLMGKGRRHLVCNEVVQAVKCFEEATQKLDGKYGPGADECGEAYLFFGKSLLELARAENGVLGNALKDAEPKSEESSDEEEEKMGAVGPKISEMSPSAKEKIRDDVQDAMADKENDDAEVKDNEKDGAAVEESEIEKETKSEEEAKEEEAGEGKEGGKDEEKGADKDEKEEMKERTEEKESQEAKKGEEESKKGAEEARKDEGEKKEGVEEGKEGAEEGKEGAEEGKEGAEEGKEGAEEGKEGEEEDEEGDEEGDEDEDMEGVEEGTEGEGKANGNQKGEEQEELDVPTMQSAWEFLELARLIFVRQENKEAQLNLAEVHLKLGEIQLEQEQFVNAVEEFQSCLDLQTKHLEADDRLIAETSYSMGLAYSLQPNHTKAHEFFSKALECLKLKISKLEAHVAEWESKSKGKGKASDKDPCVADRKELEELENLYPEIKARVDDAHEMMNSAPKEQESVTTEGFGTSSTEGVPTNTIPVKQTATLIPVRRKRKPEGESSSSVGQDTEVPVKKARQEEEQPKPAPAVTENGHDPNGNGNATEQK
ncbi:histone-binding protein N1/N2-like isoform X3 [Stylophora pistillata]|uniref:histone-binding protein N1/N2-like isoform X3 n=1 Tax=Stylophora pistillata TaxID=50429 RepID=UPI000C041D60|nr:histone-binding protein N1/N2-like isoform X3 [Stylophora pistillata]